MIYFEKEQNSNEKQLDEIKNVNEEIQKEIKIEPKKEKITQIENFNITLLIVLIIFCWPAGIVYGITQNKKDSLITLGIIYGFLYLATIISFIVIAIIL
ncbi:hypothetical protein VBM87_00450 [Mycoplasma sp. 744]|uniref:hypothetical protein n=1 Tax=Mycoplasma sp. 744 TaxID=3108531 RepID=UPI002B1D459A|nr:hypothetical protein [Mycoplasma sp. 744]MEA4115259.1 hypothetical protein [Mycoplasma sp. 744]